MGDQDRVTIAKYLNMSDVFMFLTKRIEGLPLNVFRSTSIGVADDNIETLTFRTNGVSEQS